MLRLPLFVSLLFIFFISAFTMPGSLAQQLPGVADDAPDYRVQALNFRVDGEEIVVNFGVTNIGAVAAQRRASVRLIDLSTGEAVAEVPELVRPLGPNGDTEASLSIAFPVRSFPPGSNIALQIAVGVDEIEPADSNTIFNNYDGISVAIPLYEAFPTAAPVPDPASAPGSGSVIVIPGLELEIDPDDRDQIALVVGIIAVSFLILVLLVAIFRRLFRRSPKFGTWQPPYATMPPLDPNSTYGRRQSWQPHAQNNLLPNPCPSGSVHPRKLLMGMDGEYLSGWRIMALRMTQYDMYGRVSRSEVLADHGIIRRLGGITRRLHKLDEDKITRRARPIARRLARQFRRKISKRSASLPIALDARLQGVHGEVRILFELYECKNGYPSALDYWEPEMTVLGKTIHETYTYSIYGQAGGETFREFNRRLKTDVERVLVAMMRSAIPQPEGMSSNTQPIKVQQPPPPTPTETAAPPAPEV